VLTDCMNMAGKLQPGISRGPTVLSLLASSEDFAFISMCLRTYQKIYARPGVCKSHFSLIFDNGHLHIAERSSVLGSCPDKSHLSFLDGTLLWWMCLVSHETVYKCC
jgi:hypothetical protein